MIRGQGILTPGERELDRNLEGFVPGLTIEEARLWRAHRLGCYCQLNLDGLLRAVVSDEAFDATVETREEQLDRELRAERQRLLALRGERVPVVDFEPVGLPEVDWMWTAA